MISSMEQLISPSKNSLSQYFCVYQRIITWALSYKLHPQIRYQNQFIIFLHRHLFPYAHSPGKLKRHASWSPRQLSFQLPSSVSHTAAYKCISKKSSEMCRPSRLMEEKTNHCLVAWNVQRKAKEVFKLTESLTIVSNKKKKGGEQITLAS